MTLSNGLAMPVPGYGTFKVPAEDTARLVETALRAGYRHIDTATHYGNEKEVGEGLRASGLAREDVFLTSKLWNADRGYDNTLRAFDRSLSLLGTDYLDLYLIHWPANRKQFGEGADALNAETWRAFETLYEQGRVRSIGVSNFLTHHLQALLQTARIVPMVDQVEFNPGWAHPELRDFCAAHRILVQAWSPLGRGRCLDHPEIVAMAARYGVSPAQLILRWVMQLGVVPLVKASSEARIRENLLPFLPEGAFSLSPEDVQTLIDLPVGPLSRQPDEVDF